MVTKFEQRAIPSTPAESNGSSLIRDEVLRQLYATMLQCRMLEERAQQLASQTRLPADYLSASGQEAAGVGCTIDLQEEDIVASAQHALIGNLLHGIPLPPKLSTLYKRAANTGEIQTRQERLRRPSTRAAGNGSNAKGKTNRKFDASIELASQFKKSRNVVVAFSAPGALSDGTWHETLSTAGAKALPIIFVCRDKLFDETANAGPGNVKSRNTGLADKAGDRHLRDRDYGFPRIPVDGHDVVAVYRVAHESIQRARRGGGPTLIECEPYFPAALERGRMGRAGNRRAGMDPIRHMELYLGRKGLFRKSWKNQLVEEFSRRLDAAIGGAAQR